MQTCRTDTIENASWNLWVQCIEKFNREMHRENINNKASKIHITGIINNFINNIINEFLFINLHKPLTLYINSDPNTWT